jgi:purine-nucleoside phosphorylase
MPGDPLRSEFIAKNFLQNAELINNVRGVQGYTGSYQGEKISVMASGMGMPSIGIYSYELFNFFGVEQILRVGSAGALRPDLKLRDIVMGQAACTNSAYGSQYHLRGNFAPIADFSLLQKCVKEAEAMGLSYHVGNLLSSDTFYDAGEGDTMAWGKMGVMAVEMEAAALYMNAAKAGKRALAICTISDSLVTGEATTAEQRQSSFTDMMELALRTAIAK